MYAPAYFYSGFVQSAITDGLTPDSKRQKLDAVTQAMKTAEQGSPTQSDPHDKQVLMLSACQINSGLKIRRNTQVLSRFVWWFSRWY